MRQRRVYAATGKGGLIQMDLGGFMIAAESGRCWTQGQWDGKAVSHVLWSFADLHCLETSREPQ